MGDIESDSAGKTAALAGVWFREDRQAGGIDEKSARPYRKCGSFDLVQKFLETPDQDESAMPPTRGQKNKIRPGYRLHGGDE
ncbi:hypothetical protein [Noviherbaspirillum humi]|uniref:hypothetical protein n=1 Tax=Noviherbaspirillum humi TaxID=1688639 RepID=UPI001160A8D7|nr:hypothetical protein [Noviherbaspirillum humi]